MEASQNAKVSIPNWYRVVAALGLLWNLMGCLAWSMEMFAQEAMMKEWSAEQQEWARSIPSWIYFVYALSVLTGVGGSIGLLMRKGWSVLLLGISLAGVIVHMVYTMGIAGGVKVMGPSSLVMPGLVIFLAVALVWLARFAKGKDWLQDSSS